MGITTCQFHFTYEQQLQVVSQQLKDAGFNDKEILCIAQTVANFNFVNRLSSGLGVELERRWFEEGPWKEIVDSALHRNSM